MQTVKESCQDIAADPLSSSQSMPDLSERLTLPHCIHSVMGQPTNPNACQPAPKALASALPQG